VFFNLKNNPFFCTDLWVIGHSFIWKKTVSLFDWGNRDYFPSHRMLKNHLSTFSLLYTLFSDDIYEHEPFVDLKNCHYIWFGKPGPFCFFSKNWKTTICSWTTSPSERRASLLDTYISHNNHAHGRLLHFCLTELVGQ
jgi:hypothetical protein